MNFLNPESAAFSRLTKITNIMILNILWVVCSLPVITLGSSTTALYYSLIKIIWEEDNGMIAMFFRSFKRNFKQGCWLTLLLAVTVCFFIIDAGLCRYVDAPYKTALIIVMVFLMTECAVVFSYAFVLVARFENSIKQTLKNALFLGISNPGTSVIVLLLNATPFILFFVMPNTFVISIPFWLVIGVGMIAYFNSKLMIRVFDRYVDTEIA